MSDYEDDYGYGDDEGGYGYEYEQEEEEYGQGVYGEEEEEFGGNIFSDEEREEREDEKVAPPEDIGFSRADDLDLAASRTAYERVGQGRVGQERFSFDNNLEIKAKMVNEIKGVDVDANTIIERLEGERRKKHLNPLATILGYIASNGGSRMDRESVERVFELILPQISAEEAVTQPDVVRYGRFWMLRGF